MLAITLENLLNRGLPRSPRARALCAELAGRSLAVEAHALTRLRLASSGVTLAVTQDDLPADATLSGGPLALLTLLGASPQSVLQRREVHISGDAELAERFRELLALTRPDIEEELSLLVGDVAAHRLARLGALAAGWGRRAADTSLMNLAEYLAHERGDLVPRAEGDEFLRGVDAVREGVDRLAARLELLEQRRGAP